MSEEMNTSLYIVTHEIVPIITVLVQFKKTILDSKYVNIKYWYKLQPTIHTCTGNQPTTI